MADQRGTWPPDASGVAGPEVRLERLTAETDVAGLFAALDDDEVWEHIPGGAPAAVEFLHARMAERLASPLYGTHLLVVRGAPSGSSSYILNEAYPDDIEIGATYIAKPLWGTGINFVMKRRMIDVAFAAGAERVRFRTDERNLRSAAAIKKLGAKADGIRLEEWIRKDGSRRTSALFVLTQEDWQRTYRKA